MKNNRNLKEEKSIIIAKTNREKVKNSGAFIQQHNANGKYYSYEGAAFDTK